MSDADLLNRLNQLVRSLESRNSGGLPIERVNVRGVLTSGGGTSADVSTVGSDDVATTKAGLHTVSHIHGYDDAEANWDRVRAGGDNADNEAATAEGALLAKSRQYVFDGAAWDRLTKGQAAMAASLPVAIASDQSAIPISGVTPGTGAANLGKAEDAAHASGDVGVMALGVRNDAAAARTSLDGDYSPVSTDSAGRVGIADLGGAISVDDDGASLTVDGTVAVSNVTTSVTPGTSAAHLGKAEDAAHSSGDTGVMALAVRNDAEAALTGTDGDYAPIAVGAAGRVRVSPSTLDAASLADATANPTTTHAAADIMTFNGTTWDRARGDITNGLDVDVTRVVPGTGTNELGKREDTAHVTGDVGVMALTVRQNTPAALAGPSGDYQPLITDGVGRLWVRVVPDRASDGGNRTHREFHGNVLTATTTLGTVNAGVTFYMTDFIITVRNGSTVTAGEWRINDGAAGSQRLGGSLGTAVAGAIPPGDTVVHQFLEYPSFAANNAIEYQEVTGDLTASITIHGFEV